MNKLTSSINTFILILILTSCSGKHTPIGIPINQNYSAATSENNLEKNVESNEDNTQKIIDTIQKYNTVEDFSEPAEENNNDNIVKEVKEDEICTEFSQELKELCTTNGGGEACNKSCWNKGFHERLVKSLEEKKNNTSQALNTPTFPYKQQATANMETEPRNFGSGRANGRKHAGTDLYAPVGRPIYAILNGKIIDHYPFYDGTYATVVDHGIFIVRYGEVKKSLNSGFKVGSTIKQGEHFAFVGHLISLNMSMLHFERYSGSNSGPLTVVSNKPYQRRADLVNPTADLKKWQFPK